LRVGTATGLALRVAVRCTRRGRLGLGLRGLGLFRHRIGVAAALIVLGQDGGDHADGCGDAIDGETHSVSEGKGHTKEASGELVKCARPSMVD
jgi:hypothetical protein